MWIGHYHQNSKEWFLAWGNDKQEAWDKVDEFASPDTGSMRELSSAGMFSFVADSSNVSERIEDDDIITEGSLAFEPSKAKERKENWLILDTVGGSEQAAQYIRRQMTGKESSSQFDMELWWGNHQPTDPSVQKKECFIVWAKSKKDALEFAKSNAGSEAVVLFKLAERGFVNFHPTYRKGQMAFSVPKEDIEGGTWMDVDGVC